MIDYQIIDEKPVVVIYRRSPLGQTESCPFCTCSHKHPLEGGHQQARCQPYWDKGRKEPADEVAAYDGTILRKADGYFVLTHPFMENSIFD